MITQALVLNNYKLFSLELYSLNMHLYSFISQIGSNILLALLLLTILIIQYLLWSLVTFVEFKC